MGISSPRWYSINEEFRRKLPIWWWDSSHAHSQFQFWKTMKFERSNSYGVINRKPSTDKVLKKYLEFW